MLKIYIDKDSKYYYPIRYTLDLIAENKDVLFNYVEDKSQADLCIGYKVSDDIRLSKKFYDLIDTGNYNHEYYFDKNPIVYTENGEEDLLSTIFYMVNCIQEYGAKEDKLDQYGRFSYKSSYQYKFGVVEDNLVQQMIDKLMDIVPQFKSLKKKESPKSELFLSHDIDILNGAWKAEIKWALLNKKWMAIFRILWFKFRGSGPWNTINELIRIHKKFDLLATFFWIPRLGTDKMGIKNADYAISSPKTQAILDTIAQEGFSNGIHKSTMESSLKEEMSMMEKSPRINRYHYLKFKLPEAWFEIESSGIPQDSSLMFAEQIGFRNNYGRPFAPYNFSTQKPFNFTEIPIHIMPGSLFYNKPVNEKEIYPRIISFIEKNKENTLLSILWHNNEYSDYQFALYKKIYNRLLKYFKKEAMNCKIEA